MKGIKLKTLHVGRKTAIASAAVAVMGLSLFGTIQAHAYAGSGTGGVVLSENSGSASDTPTFTTTAGCPNGFTGSAVLVAVMPDYTVANDDVQNISNAVSTSVTGAITSPQALIGSMGEIQQLFGFTTGQTTEIALQCFVAGGINGTSSISLDGFVTWTASGFTYSQTPPAGAATPTVTVSATPQVAQSGSTVTITATVQVGGTPVTTGSVQFSDNGGAIGGAVNVTNGQAVLPETFTGVTGPQVLSAAYTSANTSTIADASSTQSFTVTITSTNPNANNETITVTVPPQGSFSFTGSANATAPLTVSGSTSLTGTGSLVPVTVTDSRTGVAPQGTGNLVNGFNGYPGWSVTGQATDFTDPNSQPAGDIPASDFNWTPSSTSTSNPGTGAGFSVANGSTGGLGTAQTLASAGEGEGDGTFNLGAGLSLAIPASAPAGAYSSVLTLTADPLANFGV